jgi:serine/threonine-protein kinase
MDGFRLTRVQLFFLAALGVLAMTVGALAFVVTNRDTPPPVAASQAPVTTAPPTTTTTTVPPTTTTPPPAPAPAPSPEQAVRELYGFLPGSTEQAWAMFAERYKAKTGKANFEQFWSTIRSVEVLSVTPRDASTVVARLRYVTTGGRVDTENRSLTMVDVQGRLLVDDSVRLGPA